MADFNWNCPHCQRAVTISGGRQSGNTHHMGMANKDGDRMLHSQFIVCPNPDCRRFTLTATLFAVSQDQRGNLVKGKFLQTWNLIPASKAKIFPSYIPEVILDDYHEACLIQDLSPKASATLSRRCLQGILRDFWEVKPTRLVDEIKEIQGKVDPVTWEAIEAVRKIGNIGAHMEADINIIVDVDANEAELLVDLVETLLREWYIGREERKARMAAIVAAAAGKKVSATPASTPSTPAQ
jgi:hypothetical protein